MDDLGGTPLFLETPDIYTVPAAKAAWIKNIQKKNAVF